MSLIQPMRSPLLHGPHPFRRVITATTEQKAEALALTREGATRIRDLCRELELPATAFDSVAQLYMNQEWGVVQRAEDQRDAQEHAQRMNIIRQLRDKRVRGQRVDDFVPMMGGLGGGDGLEMASDEDLAQLAKQHGIE